MKTCIWCKTESTKIAVEHIIPDALGCPPYLVLKNGEVCEGCNNRLSHLDRAVADEFDFVAFERNIPRKGGRPPAIRSRGNVVATKGTAGSEMSFNMERYAVRAHDGSVLGARGKSRRNVNATFERDGPFAKISFEIEFGQDPKFLRGLSKIALSAFTYYMGAERALSAEFDNVRAYVLRGEGVRNVVMKTSNSSENRLLAPIEFDGGAYVVPFSVLRTDFFVDLSPKMTALPIVAEWMREQHDEIGWTTL